MQRLTVWKHDLFDTVLSHKWFLFTALLFVPTNIRTNTHAADVTKVFKHTEQSIKTANWS